MTTGAKDLNMFRIGEFSKLCRVPVSALRYYADIGLLEPAHVDPFTKYRYYSADQLPRLNRILALRDLGLSLGQISQALNDNLSIDEMRGMLRLRQAEIEQQVQEEQARLDRVAAKIKQIAMEGKMPEQEVVLKSIETIHCLSIREVIAQPEMVGTVMEESYGAMLPCGINPAGQPFTVYHDPEFKPENLDVEFIFPVAPNITEEVPLSEDRHLIPKDLPEIANAATIIHKGDYATLDQSYSAIARWIQDNGYQVAGPAREVYLTAPGDPAGILTEIQFPVTKA
jgi:DNA-binding transcriptional MerR regulator